MQYENIIKGIVEDLIVKFKITRRDAAINILFYNILNRISGCKFKYLIKQ